MVAGVGIVSPPTIPTERRTQLSAASPVLRDRLYPFCSHCIPVLCIPFLPFQGQKGQRGYPGFPVRPQLAFCHEALSL